MLCRNIANIFLEKDTYIFGQSVLDLMIKTFLQFWSIILRPLCLGPTQKKKKKKKIAAPKRVQKVYNQRNGRCQRSFKHPEEGVKLSLGVRWKEGSWKFYVYWEGLRKVLLYQNWNFPFPHQSILKRSLITSSTTPSPAAHHSLDKEACIEATFWFIS